MIGTLTDTDYGGVITFSSSAASFSSTLVPGTTANKDAMQSWMDDNVIASGSTDYRDAFAQVWSLLAATDLASARTGCTH